MSRSVKLHVGGRQPLHSLEFPLELANTAQGNACTSVELAVTDGDVGAVSFEG